MNYLLTYPVTYFVSKKEGCRVSYHILFFVSTRPFHLLWPFHSYPILIFVGPIPQKCNKTTFLLRLLYTKSVSVVDVSSSSRPRLSLVECVGRRRNLLISRNVPSGKFSNRGRVSHPGPNVFEGLGPLGVLFLSELGSRLSLNQNCVHRYVVSLFNDKKKGR